MLKDMCIKHVSISIPNKIQNTLSVILHRRIKETYNHDFMICITLAKLKF